MKLAAVSDVKSRLSRYLSRVKAGEEIIVTERGTPVARIVPVVDRLTGEPKRLASLERSGLVRLGGGRIPKSFWTAARPADPKNRVRAALAAERSAGR